jgi:5-methylcytosine-specific restriction enzyme subunit McrC
LANKTQPKIIELAEYEFKQLASDEIALDVGETLWRNYGGQVAVDFPSPKTGDQWRLTAQGWVGYIPVSEELGIALRPKIHLSNLFRMLEYAYRLESFKFLDDLFASKSLEEFYERLANVLARRIVDRSRKGLYRAYLARTERLPFVRGRLNVRQLVRAPWDVELQSHYHEHTADLEDNQILAWTLYVVTHSGLLTERVLPTVRRAYRALQGSVTLKPFGPKACMERLYNRLNEELIQPACMSSLSRSGSIQIFLGSRQLLHESCTS